MRRQISWWLKGHTHTGAALDDHAAAIRDLQGKLADLTDAVARIESGADGTIAAQMRASVDDLSARIGALAKAGELADRVADLERSVHQLTLVVAPPRDG